MGRGAACEEGTGASLLYGPTRRRRSLPEPRAALPEMVKVDSSNIAEIGFRPFASVVDEIPVGELFVRFRDDVLYRWDNVEAETHRQMMAASSKGSFLHRNIKGLYPSHKIED